MEECLSQRHRDHGGKIFYPQIDADEHRLRIEKVTSSFVPFVVKSFFFSRKDAKKIF